MGLSFLAPAATLYVLVLADVVRVIAEQIPDPADWAWAMAIVRQFCSTTPAPRIFFDDLCDIWVFSRN